MLHGACVLVIVTGNKPSVGPRHPVPHAAFYVTLFSTPAFPLHNVPRGESRPNGRGRSVCRVSWACPPSARQALHTMNPFRISEKNGTRGWGGGTATWFRHCHGQAWGFANINKIKRPRTKQTARPPPGSLIPARCEHPEGRAEPWCRGACAVPTARGRCPSCWLASCTPPAAGSVLGRPRARTGRPSRGAPAGLAAPRGSMGPSGVIRSWECPHGHGGVCLALCRAACLLPVPPVPQERRDAHRPCTAGDALGAVTRGHEDVALEKGSLVTPGHRGACSWPDASPILSHVVCLRAAKCAVRNHIYHLMKNQGKPISSEKMRVFFFFSIRW